MKILLVVGTRPEAIKMVPVYRALVAIGDCDPRIVLTGQHREMARSVLDLFAIEPSYDLDVMEQGQTLSSLLARITSSLSVLVRETRPDAMVVQGDTTSAMVGGLLGMYSRCPIAHVEAGLRTGNLQAPFPEEFNRRVIALATRWHFAPTEAAAENLRKEGIVGGVHVVGNTVIDAAIDVARMITPRMAELKHRLPFLGDTSKKTVLVTTHRRENFGEPMLEIAHAVSSIANTCNDVEFVIPVHPNPVVGEALRPILSRLPNVHLIEPLEYDELVFVLKNSFLILTDSGGLQEEAPAFDVPVLVLRNETERMEGVRAGCSQLIGTSRDNLVGAVKHLLGDRQLHARMAQAPNPYGDGRAGQAIARIMLGRCGGA